MPRAAVYLVSLAAIPLLVVFLCHVPCSVTGERAVGPEDVMDISLQFLLFGETHNSCAIGLTHDRAFVRVEYRHVYVSIVNQTLSAGPWIFLDNVEGKCSNVYSQSTPVCIHPCSVSYRETAKFYNGANFQIAAKVAREKL